MHLALLPYARPLSMEYNRPRSLVTHLVVGVCTPYSSNTYQLCSILADLCCIVHDAQLMLSKDTVSKGSTCLRG